MEVVMYLRKLLSMVDARTAGEAALSKAMENSDWPVAIAVVDATSELVYFVKMDNSSPLYAKMAINKAYTVVHFEMDNIMQFLKPQGLEISAWPDPKFTPMGGTIIKDSDGVVLGGIGASGRRPDIHNVSDRDIEMAGVKALSL
jgi:uncharacterized protein GlcG (DUF336 family)